MDKATAVSILQELIRSEITTPDQKAALEKAITAIQTDRLMDALQILAPLLGVIIK